MALEVTIVSFPDIDTLSLLNLMRPHTRLSEERKISGSVVSYEILVNDDETVKILESSIKNVNI